MANVKFTSFFFLWTDFLLISLFRSVSNGVLRGERVVVEVMTTERAWKRGTLQTLHMATLGSVWNLSHRLNTCLILVQ